jgi:hypothetical protein
VSEPTYSLRVVDIWPLLVALGDPRGALVLENLIMLKDNPYPPNAVASPRGGGRLVLVVEGVSIEYEFIGEYMINCTGLWEGDDDR